MTVVAHSGHWLVQLLYAAPVVAFLGALVFARIKEKRADRAAEAERQGEAP